MGDNEILTLTVDLNNDPFNQKADEIGERIAQIQEKSKDLRPEVDTLDVPSFNKAMDARVDGWLKSLDAIDKTRRAADKAFNSNERESLEAQYQRKSEVAYNAVKDLTNSKALIREITGNMEKQIATEFGRGLETVFTQLGDGLKTTATQLGQTMKGKLNDKEIVTQFMKSEPYRKAMAPLKTTSPGVYTDERMEKYLTASLPLHVPQYLRQSITGGSAIQMPSKPTTFRELLPSAFRSIAASRPTDARLLRSLSKDNTPLTETEIAALTKMVTEDRYAGDAAVAAGLFYKSAGDWHRNPNNMTRGHVNAMSSILFQNDIVGSAKGERKYGITNVDDPYQFDKIYRKVGNNKGLDHGRRVAYAMSDSFSWLSPGYYADVSPSQSANSEYVGPIQQSPRTSSNSYAEYTLDMMKNGVQINGVNPVVKDYRTGKWVTLNGITRPMQATSKGNTSKRDISPGDFHTVPFAGSMLHDIISGVLPNAAGNREFDDSAIYLKYDSELSSPMLPKKDRARYESELAQLYKNGYTVNGEHYSSTRIGKTHAEFIKDSVIRSLGRMELGLDEKDAADDAELFRAGMNLLANGAGLDDFTDRKAYSKALYNQNLLATEGENLKTYWGIPFGFSENDATRAALSGQNVSEARRNYIMRTLGTPNVKVAVGSFGADMDGANWGFSRFINEGGQGRSYGGKATYVKVDMAGMKAAYPQLIRENTLTAEKIAALGEGATPEQRQAILNQYGDFLLPGAGLYGNDLLLDWDTDIVEDRKNIKNFDRMFPLAKAEGELTPQEIAARQQMINESRSRDISRFGISYKTTYGDAATSSRWISKQLVKGAMAAGFGDPEVAQYFQNVLFDEIGRLSNDDQYIRDTVFNGDQEIDLNSPEAKNAVRAHTSQLLARYEQGERLLPYGTGFSDTHLGMAAPNPVNVMNNVLRRYNEAHPENQIPLSAEQEALELGNNDVISMNSIAEQLGIIRHPATINGNIEARNLIRDKTIGPKIQKMAEQLGVDPNGLYFRPDSPIMKLMQGEDFDGDLNRLFGLTGTKNPKLNEILGKVFSISNSYNEQLATDVLRRKGFLGPDEKLTPEKLEAYQDQLKEAQTIHEKGKTEPYGVRNESDKSHHTVEMLRDTGMMGAADRAADMWALLGNKDIPDYVAEAILDYESQYDVVSTHMKTGDEWDKTQAQEIASKYGRSFGNIFNWIGKGIQEDFIDGKSVRLWNGKSQDYFNAHNIDEVNLPTLSEGPIIAQLLGKVRANREGLPTGELNEDGTPVYDIDRIFATLPKIENPNSATGRFTQTLRDVKRDIASGRYLAPSEEQEAEIDRLYTAAYREIETDVANKGYTDPRDELDEINERFRKAGLSVWGRYKTENGLRVSNIAGDERASNMLANTANAIGVPTDTLFGTVSTPVQSVPVVVTASPTVQTTQQPQTEIKPTRNGVEITTSDRNPESAAIKSELPKVEAPELTPREEARKLVISALKGAPNKEALADEVLQLEGLIPAIESGNTSVFDGINGIKQKRGESILKALAGTRFAQIKPGGSPSGTVGEIIIPDMTDEIQKAEEEIRASSQAIPSLITKEAMEAQRKKVSGYILNDSYTADPYIESLKFNIGRYESMDDAKFNQIRDGVAGSTMTGYNRKDYIAKLKSDLAELQEYKRMKAQYNSQQNSQQETIETTPPVSNQPPVSIAPPTPPGSPPKNPPVDLDAFEQRIAGAMYSDAFSKAEDFSKNLFVDRLKYEQKLKETPNEIAQLEKNQGIARRYEHDLREIMASPFYSAMDEEQQWKLQRMLDPNTGLTAMAGRDFADMSMYGSHHLSDDIATAASKATGTYDSQVEALEAWDKKIQDVTKNQEKLLEMADDPKAGNKVKEEYKAAADEVGKDLEKIKASRSDIQKGYQTQNQKTFEKQLDTLDDQLNPGSKIQKTSKRYQEQISSLREQITQKHNSGMITDNAFDQDMARLDEFSKQASTASLTAQQMFQGLESSIGRVAQRLGRQLFQKALAETKKFVQDFDKSMTSIQMITLKSDKQMSTLGDGLIDKAKEMKISVSEVTQSAETLYRQGLSDQEVDERLEVISKFSKVSGTKVADATKLITIGMNTGLVTDASVAADIVTALGDNAATNASEIEKGIEKAGAAAAADGTTFSELTSMLTAITSTTQIGGNIAGRTLNTIFGRMNKIGTNELIYDENGNAISGSAVAQLLQAQGINMYENGQKRSSYDVLYELSQVWDSMSDAAQQQIANAIAGTRQYSNFAAIMQGMSEGNVDEYMDLAANASGITDQKYEIYTKSLEASLTNLRNTYDELVNDLTDSGALTGMIDTFSGMIQGVDNLATSFGGLGGAITAVMPLLIAFTMLKAGAATGNVGLLAGGIGVGAIAAFGLSAAGNAPKAETAQERYERITTAKQKSYNELSNNIDRAKELRALGSNRTKEQGEEYNKLLTLLAQDAGFDKLASASSDATSGVESLAESAKTLGDAANSASGSVEDYANQIIEGAEAAKDNEKAKQFAEGLGEFSRAVGEEYSSAGQTFDSTPGVNNLVNYLFGIDQATGEITVGENAHKHLTESGYNDVFALQGRNGTVQQSFASVFSQALDHVDTRKYENFPTEYLGRDEAYWKTFSQSRQDLPDVVLEAVADYWNQNPTTRSSQTRTATEGKIKELLTGEGYNFIPQEYLDAIPAAVFDLLPESATGEKIASSQNVYEAMLAISGLAGREDLSTLTTGEIVSNIGAYLGSTATSAPLTGKVTYGGNTYDNEFVARAARDRDLAAFMESNPIDEYRFFGEAGFAVGRDDAEYEAARQRAREKYVDSELEGYLDEVKYSIGGRDYYTLGGNAYTNREEAEAKAREELRNQWEWENPANTTPETFTYNNVDYNSREDAEAARRADFNGTADRSIQAAAEAEETVKDLFKAGASTGYTEWTTDKSNAYGLRVDKVLRDMQEAGVSDIDSLVDFVRSSNGTDWEYLTSGNGEFGRLISSLQYNENGNVINPGAYDQIMNFLFTNGKDYQTPTLTSQQKAKQASSAFSALTTGNGYVSWEAAVDAAQQTEDANREAYEADIQQRVNERVSHVTGTVPEYMRERFEQEIREENPYTGQTAEQIAAGYTVLTDDQKIYLKNVLGDELSSKVINGTPLTDEEQRYSQTLLGNAEAGISSLTSAQRISGMKEVRAAIAEGTFGKEGGYSRSVADQYMSGWSGWAEYASLLEAQANGEEIDVGRLNDLSLALDNIQREAEIAFEVEGVEELEKAGLAIDGTSTAISNLMSANPTKAAEAISEIVQSARQSGQLDYNLENGTYSQQNKAAMDILGITDEKEFLANREENIQKAKERQAMSREAQARTFAEEYAAAQTPEARRAIKEAARAAGYVEEYNQGTFMYDQSVLEQNAIGAQALIDNTVAAAAENSLYRVYASIYEAGIGTSGEIETEIGKYDFGRLYESDEVFKNMMALGADSEAVRQYTGRMARGQTGTTEQNYGWFMDQFLGGSDVSQWTAESLKRNYADLQGNQAALDVFNTLMGQMAGGDEILKYLTTGEGDVNSAIEAWQQDQLQRAQNGSLENRAAYAKSVYDQNNKASNAAESLFSVLSKGQNFDSFGDFIESVGSGEVQDWKDLIDAAPELSKKMSDLGFSFDEDELKFNGEPEEFKSALSALASAIAEASNQITDVTTHGEDLERAEEYLRTGNEEYYDEFSSVIGDADIAARIQNNLLASKDVTNDQIEQLGRAYGASSPEEAALIMQRAQASGLSAVYGEGGEFRGFERDAFAGFSGYEKDYYNMLMGNARSGYTGLTEEQKYTGANILLDQMRNGTLSSFWSEQDTSMISDYSSLMPEDYLSNAMALEKAKITNDNGERVTMENLGSLEVNSQAYKDAQAALGGYQGAVEKAIDSNRDFKETIDSVKFNNLAAGTEYADEAAQSMVNLGKGGKTAAQELANLKKKTLDLQDVKTAASKAKGKSGSKLDSTTRSIIASYLGTDADAIKKYSKSEMSKIVDELESSVDEEFNATVFQPMIQSAFDDINSALASGEIDYELDVKPIINTDGSVSMEGLISLLNKINSDFAATAESMAGEIVEYLITVHAESDGNGGRVTVESTTSGIGSDSTGSYNSSGGGGGGGQSDAEELIEDLGHETTKFKHNLTMVQTRQTHYGNINDYDAYMGSIADERFALTELQDMYADHISQLQAEMDATEEGSDDWYSLRDAIYEAQEALEDVTNSLDELNAKVIEAMSEKATNEANPETHISTMLEKRASRYQQLGQFENWRSVTEQENDQLEQNVIPLYQDQMKAYMLQMASMEIGTDAWIEARDLVYDLSEKIADAENQMISNQIAINEALVTQIGTDLTNASATETHDANLYGSASEIYQRHERYGLYRSTLNSQSANYQEQIEDYKNAREQQLAAMDEIEAWEKEQGYQEGNHSDAWYSARDAAYSYEETLLDLVNALDETNAALQESLIQEVVDKYEDYTADAEHVKKMYQTQAEIYKESGDEDMYLATLKGEYSQLTKDFDERKTYLAQLEALEKSGTITDPQKWDTLRSQIYSMREELASTELEAIKLDKQIRQIDFDNLMEDFNREDSLNQHQIKMIQYMETRYQNNGELTNYGTMLQYEQDAQAKRRDSIENNLAELNVQLAKAQAAGDEETYYKITQEIYKEEETLEQVKTQWQKINTLVEQNQEKIRQVQQTLENEIVKEIKTREQKEKNMLNAEINLQNQILNAIKKRYQEEWALVKKDIQAKQKALQEEKSLINERLQARKNAQSQEDKWEELAEYQRQLALISMDPSRSKDVMELQRKIEDLQKELSWEIADQEAQAAQEAIDQQIEAMNDYVSSYEEDLNDLLSDANNFHAEMEQLLSFAVADEFDTTAFDRYVEYMKEIDTNYQNSTEETRKKIEEEWRQTWLTMQGLTETYWNDEDFLRTFKSRDEFLAYMKASDQYRDASESGQQSLVYKWSEMYDNYVKSTVGGATFDDAHATYEEVATANTYLHDLSTLVKTTGDDISLITDMMSYLFSENKDTGWRKSDLTDEADAYTSLLEDEQNSLSDTGYIDESEIKGEYGYTFIYDGVPYAEYGFKTKKDAENAAKKAINDLYSKNTFDENKKNALAEWYGWSQEEVDDYIAKQKNARTDARADIWAEKYTRTTTSDSDSSSDTTTTSSDSGSGGGGGTTTTTTETDTTSHGFSFKYDGGDVSGSGYSSKDAAYKGALSTMSTKAAVKINQLVNSGYSQLDAIAEESKIRALAMSSLKYYLHGGIVDYTGPAWVDGTKSRPEAFLDAYDTKAIEAMTEALRYVYISPGVMPGADTGVSNNMNVGDINIVINQAELKSDADYDEVARKIGQAFTKQMSKNGLNLTGYAF